MKGKTILLVIVVVLIIAIAVASAVYSFGHKQKPVDASKAVAPTEQAGGPGSGVFSPETAPKKPTRGR